jgi:hypothetical protein
MAGWREEALGRGPRRGVLRTALCSQTGLTAVRRTNATHLLGLTGPEAVTVGSEPSAACNLKPGRPASAF